jgi:short-subunit dehydrogenase
MTEKAIGLRPCALITGASMGLGAEFARQLARNGYDLLLVARSKDKLETIAQECRSAGSRVAWLSSDLTAEGETRRVAEWALDLPDGLRTTMLVNNAGFGDAGAFSEMDPDRVSGMVRLNVLALTELTSRLLPILRQAPPGQARIILVSSVAGYQPLPYFAVYAATKAFVTHFGEALHEELRPDGIRVTVLCPGVTRTEFGKNGRGLAKELFAKGASAAAVVDQAIAANEKGRAICNTADSVRITLSRLVPRGIVRKVAGQIARRILVTR